MEKGKGISLILITSLTLATVLHAVATSYWSGVNMDYISSRYDPCIHYRISHGGKPDWITTSLMIYNYSGVLYVIKTYNNTAIRFNISDENNGYILSQVQIELRNVTVMTVLPKGIRPPIFWNTSEVISTKTEESRDPDFKNWVWHVFKLRSVSLGGSYLIRKTDLQVVKDGEVYGHTMLFDSPLHPLGRGGSFSRYPFSTIIDKVTVDNKNLKRWRNITYYPPLKTVVTSRYSFNLTQPFGKGYPLVNVQMAVMIYTFDASDGKLVFTPNGGPDLWAVGVLSAYFSDEYSLYQVEVKGDDSYATGLVLESFKTEVERFEVATFRNPDVKTAYAFYCSLVILGVILFVNRKRRGTNG
jgi:hypothetical protein